jgi:general secretion pathway protein A
MYLSFFGFREEPFGVTPDPRFLYLSAAHRESLASLYYGMEATRGFLALIAKPGMGKTTLLFHLLERFRTTAHTAFLFQTQCDSREFMRLLLGELGYEEDTQDIVRMHDELNKRLLQGAQAGRRLMVVVDEAQNLEPPVLETLRLLSNFETPQAKLMHIILAGQPGLADKLASPGLAQLRQRVSIVQGLEPLSSGEIKNYVEHRLRIAGYTGGPLFTVDAYEAMARFAEGIPRSVNNFCFHALSLACALQKKIVDPDIVEEVTSDLDISGLTSSRSLGAGGIDSPYRYGESVARAQAVVHNDAEGLSRAGAAVYRNHDQQPLIDKLCRAATVKNVYPMPIRKTEAAAPTKLVEMSRGVVGMDLPQVAGSEGISIRSRRPSHSRTNVGPFSKRGAVVEEISTRRKDSADQTEAKKADPVPADPDSGKQIRGRLQWALIAALGAALLGIVFYLRDGRPVPSAAVPPPEEVQQSQPAIRMQPAIASRHYESTHGKTATFARAPVATIHAAPAQRLQVAEAPVSGFSYPVAPSPSLTGKVILKVVIDADGTVRKVDIVAGNRALADAAVRAVRHWRYRPHELNGHVVEAETNIAVSFLGDDAVSISFPGSPAPIR